MKKYTTYLKEQYQNDLKYSRQFLFSFSSNYALATRFFSPIVQESTIIFYAFVRYADELIDNPDKQMPGKTHATIVDFVNEWNQCKENTDNNLQQFHPVIRATYVLFIEKGIPLNYIDDFLIAMMQDQYKERYINYTELERYMWGSASVVGHVMTFFVGYIDKHAFEYAKTLGEAMQLTNFLRDISEDYDERNRIYLPQQDLSVFGVTESMIQNHKMTDELSNLVKMYVEKNRKMYTEANKGLHYLNEGQFAILLASRIYEYNLTILEKRNYDIFGPSIRVSLFRKFLLIIKTLFSTIFQKIT